MKRNSIAILLPYKDHFTRSNAGSASIWVKDFNKRSQFKNDTLIFGNTPHLKDLISKSNYINLPVKEINLGSKNASYVNEFIKYNEKYKAELIEVHNRPSYVHQILKNNVNSKIILIFHNNPLTLGGSESVEERKLLIEVFSLKVAI